MTEAQKFEKALDVFCRVASNLTLVEKGIITLEEHNDLVYLFNSLCEIITQWTETHPETHEQPTGDEWLNDDEDEED